MNGFSWDNVIEKKSKKTGNGVDLGHSRSHQFSVLSVTRSVLSVTRSPWYSTLPFLCTDRILGVSLLSQSYYVRVSG